MKQDRRLIGVQSIREILEERQVYVDKTGFARDLISKGKHYFMSRPRRYSFPEETSNFWVLYLMRNYKRTLERQIFV